MFSLGWTKLQIILTKRNQSSYKITSIQIIFEIYG